jgi:Ca2+/H+ antiporter
MTIMIKKTSIEILYCINSLPIVHYRHTVIYRNRTDNRPETGQTIEQKQDRQYIVCLVSVLLSVLFLIYCLSYFYSIVCPVSVLCSVLFLFYCLSFVWSIVCHVSFFRTETGQTIEQKQERQ